MLPKDSIKRGSLLIFLLALIIASIKPLHYPSYLLHQLGTLIMLGFLWWVHRRMNVSRLAFVGYMSFLMIHVLAAHYLYSYVPYNDWLIKAFGINSDQIFGFRRNMFDRLVHFCYGLLLYPFIYEGLERFFAPLNRTKIHLISVGFVMASSMVYELIEWWLAMGLSAESAENYNGQQGDMWDAHKDMFLASVGSIVVACLLRHQPTNKSVC